MKTVTCPNCDFKGTIFFERRKFSLIRDATAVNFICSYCTHRWSGRLYWRARYSNIEDHTAPRK